MKIEEKIDNYLNESSQSLTYKDIEKFRQDPLYSKVLNSENKKEFEENLRTLRDVRGEDAVDNLREILKLMKNM